MDQLSKFGTASLAFEKRFECIGPSPDAIMLHHPLISGSVSCPSFQARTLPRGGEWSTVRADGLIVVDARCILETSEGGLIFVSYSGTCNVGEDGYDALLDGKSLGRAWLHVALRFHTSSHDYRWLNRLQCFGTGERDYIQSSLQVSIYAFIRDCAEVV
jgi:Protein of unknown function (DUF3237)